MKQIYTLVAELRVLLGRELCALTFDPESPQHRYVTALYASTLELAGDALVLVQHGRHSGLPILTRSALEAHIHMLALLSDPEYYNRMLATFHHEDERMYKNALNMNQGLTQSAPATVSEFEARCDKATDELHQLEAKGFRRVDIKCSFVLAGRQNWYSPIYSKLCSHSHNNLNVVAHRHFEVHGDTYRPVFEREWSDEDIVKFIANLGMIIMDAHSAIAAFFKIAETDAITKTITGIVAEIAKRQGIEQGASGFAPAIAHSEAKISPN